MRYDLTSYDFQELDPIGNLAPLYGNLTFYKQMVNDPVVGGILFHYRSLISQIKFSQSIEVFDDKTFGAIINDFFMAIMQGSFCGVKVK